MKKRQADFVRKYMRELRHALPINYPNQKKILHSIKQNLINYINENPYSDYSNLTNEFGTLRIPGYTKEFTVWRGAQKIKTPLIKKGYLMITDLAASEEIKISCDMKARFVYANPKVRADEGKACIMRGPLVYCLEETDNGENLSSLYVDTKEALTENWEEQVLGGVMTVEAKGKRILEDHWTAEELYKEQPPELKDVTLKAVPYCYWGNRKTGEMAVWIRQLI